MSLRTLVLGVLSGCWACAPNVIEKRALPSNLGTDLGQAVVVAVASADGHTRRVAISDAPVSLEVSSDSELFAFGFDCSASELGIEEGELGREVVLVPPIASYTSLPDVDVWTPIDGSAASAKVAIEFRSPAACEQLELVSKIVPPDDLFIASVVPLSDRRVGLATTRGWVFELDLETGAQTALERVQAQALLRLADGRIAAVGTLGRVWRGDFERGFELAIEGGPFGPAGLVSRLRAVAALDGSLYVLETAALDPVELKRARVFRVRDGNVEHVLTSTVPYEGDLQRAGIVAVENDVYFTAFEDRIGHVSSDGEVTFVRAPDSGHVATAIFFDGRELWVGSDAGAIHSDALASPVERIPPSLDLATRSVDAFLEGPGGTVFAFLAGAEVISLDDRLVCSSRAQGAPAGVNVESVSWVGERFVMGLARGRNDLGGTELLLARPKGANRCRPAP
ncbi:MAG: hypothetical protein HY791_36910 [Deltaproteobacteria bacterium]|nr:hypothetical protein [Deltaproteobacteria bacterium]